MPTNDVWVQSVIRKVDGPGASMLEETNIPGMAVAVVHDGEIAFAKGYGVREVGRPETVNADTVFQPASVSKPIGATVIAHGVGKGTVAWDYPIVTHLPDHAGDLLEDLGYDRADVRSKLKYEPLNRSRAVYDYITFGNTSGAESVARAAGVDWAELSRA